MVFGKGDITKFSWVYPAVSKNGGVSVLN